MKIYTLVSDTSSKVVSPILLLCCFGICLGSAYFLIPKGDELYHLLLADGERERVMELVIAEEAPVGTAEQVESIDYQRLMKIAFDSLGHGALSKEEVARITAVLEHCEPTSAGFENLKRHADEISDREKEYFFGVLARRALGESDPSLAAEIYTELALRVKSLGVDTVELMVKSYRYAGQSERAFESIDRLSRQLGSVDRLPADLRDIYVSLLMEVDRAGEAFDILRADFEKGKGDVARLEEMLPKLVTAASYSERGAELPRYYEMYFAVLPESGYSLEKLAQLGRSEVAQSVVSFQDNAKIYAQICEWNDLYDQSFEYYLKCAALGDEWCLQRVISLNEGLLRSAELAEVLSYLVPVAGHPEYQLMLARLLGEEARYGEARVCYEDYLRTNVDDAVAYLELGALCEESGDLVAAMKQYQKTLEFTPDETALKIRIAGLHVAFGEPERAFEIYRALPDEAHDDHTLESLQMLAEAHGDYDELNRAMGIGFAKMKAPTAESFLDLAQSHSLRGDTAQELRVLTGAMYQLPESQRIAVALADVLYRESRFDEAMKLLTRQDLRDNMQAMSMFIEICGGTDQHQYASRYLVANIEEEFDFPPSVRIELGQIYEETGKLDAAQRLYASVPEGGMAWQLLATAKFKTGEYDRAEEYQRRYLKAAEQPDAQDWVFLGDICKNLGKEREATEAYKHSLNLLKSELKPHNASL